MHFTDIKLPPSAARMRRETFVQTQKVRRGSTSRTALENNWQNLFAAEVGVSTYGGRSCTFVTGGKERA